MSAPPLIFLAVTSDGGEAIPVLVAPTLLVPFSFSYGSDSFTGTLPTDVELCGSSIDLQVLELDAGAPFGVSFTPGLELVLGR